MEKVVKVGLHVIEKWGSDLEAQVRKYEERNDEKSDYLRNI